MTVLGYIERQKNLIRSRHEGEIYFSHSDGTVINLPERTAREILAEIDAMPGLCGDRERVASYGDGDFCRPFCRDKYCGESVAQLF